MNWFENITVAVIAVSFAALVGCYYESPVTENYHNTDSHNPIDTVITPNDCNGSLEITQPNVSSVSTRCWGMEDVKWRADCADGSEESGKIYCDWQHYDIDPTCGQAVVVVYSEACNREVRGGTE